jgi:rhodanese-related sulfurtransferase
MRPFLKFLLIVIVLPILVGGIVLFVAGRPLAFEILQHRIAARFPDVKWISTQDLGRWQEDAGQPQPLILDARTQPEYQVSHLKGAVLIDPYRPSLQPVRQTQQSGSIVVYSSAGYRGARVASWLSRAGYTSVVSLAGGLFKWANEGRPMFQAENRPAALVHPYDQRWGLLVDGRYRAQAPELEKRSAGP